jgi:hypothetical protein
MTASARPVPEDLRHRQLGIVIEDRLRHAADEGEGLDMAVAERLGRLSMIGLHEDRVALRQVHDEEPDLLLDAAQDHDSLAEIRLGMPGRMRQRDEDFLPTWRRERT